MRFCLASLLLLALGCSSAVERIDGDITCHAASAGIEDGYEVVEFNNEKRGVEKKPIAGPAGISAQFLKPKPPESEIFLLVNLSDEALAQLRKHLSDNPNAQIAWRYKQTIFNISRPVTEVEKQMVLSFQEK